MYIKKFNPYRLKDGDIDKKVTRVKVLIFNEDNKILLCNVEGKYTFVGGHVEENEIIEAALIRELAEETGMVLNNQDFNSLVKIEKWNKNHFNTGKNCLSEIYYYSLYTNESIDLGKMNLDESEKRKNFFLKYMDINDFYDYLQYQIKTLNSELHKEMLYAFNYYLKKIYRGKVNEKQLQKKL